MGRHSQADPTPDEQDPRPTPGEPTTPTSSPADDRADPYAAWTPVPPDAPPAADPVAAAQPVGVHHATADQAAADETRDPVTDTGSHRVRSTTTGSFARYSDEPTVSFAQHRGESSTRSLSRGPVVAASAVVLVAAMTFGWFQLRQNVSEQAADAAAMCVDGASTVNVAADPAIAAPLTEIAKRFNATGPVVRDKCIDVVVSDAPSAAALSGLQKEWDVDVLGPEPAAWVAADSSFTDRVASTSAARLDGNPTSVARSPLVLSVPGDVGPALSDSGLTWADLPELQDDPSAWAKFDRPEWGAMTVAVPSGVDGATSAPMMAQAVAAGTGDGGVPTVATLRAPGVSDALTELGRGPNPASTEAALLELATSNDVTGSDFRAVPATEQQVFDVARTEPGSISAAVLDGPAPEADYPFALVSGDAVDDTQSRAAAAFEEFVIGPDAQQVLADDGFRTTSGVMPDGGASVTFGPEPDPLGRTDLRSADALTAALGPRP